MPSSINPSLVSHFISLRFSLSAIAPVITINSAMATLDRRVALIMLMLCSVGSMGFCVWSERWLRSVFQSPPTLASWVSLKIYASVA